MRCSCTINDVRREQIEEASGRLWVRLVCNLCNAEVDVGIPDRVRDQASARVSRSRPKAEPGLGERAGSEY
jgi:hypothetical protein